MSSSTTKPQATETAGRFILTLWTADGFQASFTLFLEELVDVAGTALAGTNAPDCETKTTTFAN